MVEARPSCARIAASIDAICAVIVLRERWGGRNADTRYFTLARSAVLLKTFCRFLQGAGVQFFVITTHIHVAKS